MLLGFAGDCGAFSGAEFPLRERRSAYEDMSRDNKAMQDDDTSNPGMLAVLDGEALVERPGPARQTPAPIATATPRASMKGVAARYPAFNRKRGPAGQSGAAHQPVPEAGPEGAAFAYESKEMLALSAYVAMQSRGEPIAPPADERLQPFIDRRP